MHLHPQATLQWTKVFFAIQLSIFQNHFAADGWKHSSYYTYWRKLNSFIIIHVIMEFEHFTIKDTNCFCKAFANWHSCRYFDVPYPNSLILDDTCGFQLFESLWHLSPYTAIVFPFILFYETHLSPKAIVYRNFFPFPFSFPMSSYFICSLSLFSVQLIWYLQWLVWLDNMVSCTCTCYSHHGDSMRFFDLYGSSSSILA